MKIRPNDRAKGLKEWALETPDKEIFVREKKRQPFDCLNGYSLRAAGRFGRLLSGWVILRTFGFCHY